MNAITKVATANSRAYGQSALWEQISLRGLGLKHISAFILMIAVIASALAVVYERDLHRRLVSQLQSEKSNLVSLKVKQNQLLLEQATYASQARIQELATHDLHMQYPDSQRVIPVYL